MLTQSVLMHPGFAFAFRPLTPESVAVIESLAPKHVSVVSTDETYESFEWLNSDSILTGTSEHPTALNLLNAIVQTPSTSPSVILESVPEPAVVETIITTSTEPKILEAPEQEMSALAGEVELTEILSQDSSTPEPAPTVEAISLPETTPELVQPEVDVITTFPASDDSSASSTPQVESASTSTPSVELNPEIAKALEDLTAQVPPPVLESSSSGTQPSNLEIQKSTNRISAPILEYSNFSYNTESHLNWPSVENLILKLNLSSLPITDGTFSVEYSSTSTVWKSLETISSNPNATTSVEHILEYNLPVAILNNLNSFKLRLVYSLSNTENYEAMNDLLVVRSLVLESRGYEQEEDLSLYNTTFLDPENFLHVDFTNENLDLSLPGSLNDPITLTTKANSARCTG